MSEIEALTTGFLDAVSRAPDLDQLDRIRVKALGKQGQLTLLLRQLKELPPEQRPSVGDSINRAKRKLQEAISGRHQQLSLEAVRRDLQGQTLDISLPGRQGYSGSIHPITQTIERISQLFANRGFSIEEGPEIEDDFYNFEALNIPVQHPARAMHDTFYLDNNYLLRTHTSPVQIRVMQARPPPIYIICPGKVYRRDSDLTHTPMFHQIEGLIVDEGISMGHLKQVVSQFISEFFEEELKVRFRPSYFPFTEPSAEVDIECQQCKGAGCRICSATGWLEVMGAGLVHPQVLKCCQLDTHSYSGLAFGMGVERLAMLRHGVDDLRLFFENDVRFLAQF